MHKGKTKVLLVDDEEAYTSLLKINLEQTHNYEVYCENVSRNACRTALNWVPDIILLDVVMPEMDGGDVRYALRHDPRLKDIPVVYVTAVVANHETRGEVVKMESGEEVLAKPFQLETLCRCIDEHVALAH